MSVNSWIFSGTLGQNSEVRETQNNKVLSFSVAIDESYKDSSGNKIEKTAWIKCSKFFKKEKSTKITDYLIQGTRVVIQGKPNATTYENKAYQECLVDRIEIIYTPKTAPF